MLFRSDNDKVKDIVCDPKLDINKATQTSGFTALMVAAMVHNEDAMGVLLKVTGIRLQLKDKEGRSALQLAATAPDNLMHKICILP